MLTKAWIAILIGLLLGSLLFSSGCGWLGNGYSNNPYYGQPCNYDAPYRCEQYPQLIRTQRHPRTARPDPRLHRPHRDPWDRR